MAVDLLLNLDDDVYQAYAGEARATGVPMEELLRKVIVAFTGRPYERPSIEELARDEAVTLMLDLRSERHDRRNIICT